MVRLDKLKSHHLDAAYRRWLLEGLSPATINSYHGVLSSALGQAVKWGLISRSVAPLATLPTVARRRMTVPDVETVRLLVTTAEDSDPVLSAAIMLAALTGCRRGELLGLRWSDVERDQMVLQVQRSIKREEFGPRFARGADQDAPGSEGRARSRDARRDRHPSPQGGRLGSGRWSDDRRRWLHAHRRSDR